MASTGTQYALFESVEPIPVEQAPQESATRRFSDYVVYVDESGDHSLASIDKDYPVFVLALCVFHKRHYAEKIVPAVEKLKFNYFGHDSVVLHENEIRKQKGDFAFLAHRPTRDAFMAGLTSIMEASNFILIAVWWIRRASAVVGQAPATPTTLRWVSAWMPCANSWPRKDRTK